MGIVILGANGNLGVQLQKQFKDDLIAAWDHADFNFLDFNELTEQLKKIKPKIIINVAAYNAVDDCEKSEKEEALAYIINRDLPAVLSDYCLINDIKLMHYSSDYVFGVEQRRIEAYNELSIPGPINKYGQSKLAGEKEIAKRALEGLNYYIIRSSRLFGPKVNNQFSKASFFKVMLNLAEKNRQVKAVDGELSCFTYTPDLAEASFDLLSDNAPRGVYHLINSGLSTWYEAAEHLYNMFDFDLELLAVKSEDWFRPAKRPSFSVLKNTRRRLLRPWQEALNEYLKSENLIH